VEGDIKGCFDNINHDWLLANIPMEKAMLRKWLMAGYMEKGAFFDTESGTPQGGIISPVLANMALDGLETTIRNHFPEAVYRGGKEVSLKVNTIRYADDFVITAGTKQTAEEILPVVREFLAKRGLELSPAKTRITHIEDGFDFLGWNVRKFGEKQLIRPAKKNVKNFLLKIRTIVKANKAAEQGVLIDKLNPVIKGWANYHRSVVASKTFSSVDHAIWACLWEWAKRRHPIKGLRWVKDKYFASIGTRNWVFNTGEVTGSAGTRKVLRCAADVKIVRHVKVLGNANFYDPDMRHYFDQRTTDRMLLSISGRKKLAALWSRQEGRCPACREMITEETGWHVHHIHGRQIPNAGALKYLELRHPNCHRQYHFRRDLETGGDLDESL